jgi:hypothetical protein
MISAKNATQEVIETYLKIVFAFKGVLKIKFLNNV